MMSTFLKLLLVVALAAMAPRIFTLFIRPFIERRVYNHQPGPCQYVKGIETGAEDMQLVLPSGVVLMTTGMRPTTDKAPYEKHKGLIKLFDFNKPEKGAEVVKIEGKLDMDTFNPHGMSIWRTPGGPVVVLVVNHGEIYKGGGAETVEKFEFNEKTRVLKHLETISDNATMHFLNDVVATGENSFYFSNVAYCRHVLAAKLELMLKLAWGSVGYYDSGTSRTVATQLDMANGINMSPDGRFVYVAESGGQSLKTYKREADNGLTLLEVYELDTVADNMDVQDEYVWLGAHCSIIKSMQSLDEPIETKSPSQVLRLRMDQGKVVEMVEVFSDNGTFFSGSSIAVPYKNMLLIGSVATKALLCENKYIG